MKLRSSTFLVLAICILIVLLITLGDHYLSDRTYDDIFKNFITSLVTSFGIFIAGMLTVWQQEQVSDRELKLRQRKSYAARSIMPTALDEICDYVRKCMKYWLQNFENYNDQHLKGRHSKLLTENQFHTDFPYDSVKSLRECIEHADEEDRNQIAECIRALQINYSRMDFFKSKYKNESHYPLYELKQIIYDTARLYRKCSRLFPYARIETEYQKKYDPEMYLLGDLHALDITEDRYPDLYSELKKILS